MKRYLPWLVLLSASLTACDPLDGPRIEGATADQHALAAELLEELAVELGPDVVRAIPVVAFVPGPLTDAGNVSRIGADSLRIEILQSVSDEVLRVALRHEVCHAMIEIRDVGASWVDDPVDWLEPEYADLSLRGRQSEVDTRLCDLGRAKLRRLVQDGGTCVDGLLAERLEAVATLGFGLAVPAHPAAAPERVLAPLGHTVRRLSPYWMGEDAVAVSVGEPIAWAALDLSSGVLDVLDGGLSGVGRAPQDEVEELDPLGRQVTARRYLFSNEGEARVAVHALPDGSEVSLLDVDGRPVQGHCLPGSASLSVRTRAVWLSGQGNEAFWYDVGDVFDRRFGVRWRQVSLHGSGALTAP